MDLTRVTMNEQFEGVFRDPGANRNIVADRSVEGKLGLNGESPFIR